MGWTALALLVIWQAQAVGVDGALACPAPEEVRAGLARLLPSDAAGPVNRARLERHGGFVRVSLLRGDGSLLADRFLDAAQPCADLAAAAAAIVASWQIGRAAESVQPLPAGAAAALEAGPARAARLDLGLGAGGSIAPAGWSPAVSLSASAVAASGMGLRATLLAGGTRAGAVGAGQLQWQRLPLALGPMLRWQPAGIRLDAHLGGAASWTRLAGQGFARNRRHDDLELGALGGLRAVPAGGGWRPWVELLGSFWPSPAIGFEERGGAAARPDRLEVFLVLGSSWMR